jgi:hypothetical protein
MLQKMHEAKSQIDIHFLADIGSSEPETKATLVGTITYGGDLLDALRSVAKSALENGEQIL